jgi:integrase/recombinase XerD
MAGKRKFPDAGDPSDPKGFLALREKFLEALGIANYSPRTVETMSARLRAFILWCDERGLTHPEDVTRAHLERFQAWVFHYRKDDGNPLDFGTQQLHIGAIKLFFKWLAKAGHIPFSPAADLEYPKKGDRLPKAVLSHAEVEQVMAAADPNTVLGLRDRAVVEVLYSTGVRRMELEGVRLEDLNVSAGTLFVRKAKGDKQRVVPLGERALAWVRKYLDDARPKLVADATEPALFLDKDGRALSKRAISALGKKLLRRANLGKTGSAHVFRHSAATAMLEGGADVRFVQELLGHSSLLSTQVYTRVAISKLREVHAATHPGARLGRPGGQHGGGEEPAIDAAPEPKNSPE